ncbi:MAG: PfkB family carbohydrate kinase [Pseudomonadota bacterium]
MIVTCGEALVDLMPERIGGDTLYRPVLGGSLYNVALGIARLGGRSSYLWELSNDHLGRRFMDSLVAEGVDCSAVRVTARATPVAIVDMSNAEPRYQIADPDGVMVDTTPAPLPAGTECLLVGSAVLAVEPVASAIEAVAGDAPLVAIDYNVRAPSIVDRDAYRARLRRIAALAGIVKASDADLELLGEGGPEAYADAVLADGGAMVVITRAEKGAQVRTAHTHTAAQTAASAVVDPVGAGDAFMAALLYRLQADGALSKQSLLRLSSQELKRLINYAQAAAAFTCARKGAVMPSTPDLVEHM